MNRKDYESSLYRQAKDLYKYNEIVYEAVDKQLEELIPMKQIWDAQKIFITGCGDCWLAGIAAKPAFESIIHIETNAMRAIEFSRVLNNKNLGYSPNTPLVLLLSFSGESTRVVECAKRAAQYGANTLAITNNPNSSLAKVCRYCINTSLPEGGEYFPGATTYNASLIALYLLALRIGRVRNQITPLEYNDMKNELLTYTKACQEKVEEYADRSFEIALKWQNLKAEDFIGDYGDYATAFFGSAKVIECFGGYTTYDDSEDWCHINYFLVEPERIGRVVIANKDTPSYSRLLETINAVKILGSPCVIVSDADKSEFPEGMEVFTLPKAKYFWMNPLCQHIPFDLIAGYIEELKGEASFRIGNDRFDNEIGNRRLKDTEIVII